MLFIDPRRACVARFTVLVLCICLSAGLSVCLSVCLSVYDYSRTTGYEAAHERYQQLQYYKGMKINVAILLKRLRSRDMAWHSATRHATRQFFSATACTALHLIRRGVCILVLFILLAIKQIVRIIIKIIW